MFAEYYNDLLSYVYQREGLRLPTVLCISNTQSRNHFVTRLLVFSPV